MKTKLVSRKGSWLLFLSSVLMASPAIFAPPAQAQTCVTAPSGIVSWWSGESNALDNVGGNNGYLVNNAGYTPGTVGMAFSFNGNNQCVRVPDSPSLRLTSALTAEAWIYVKNGGGVFGSSILVKYDAPGHFGQAAYCFALSGNLQPYLILSSDGTNTQANVASSNSVPLNTWTHVAATYDGSQINLYVNGQLDTSAPFSGTIFSGSDDLGIGGSVGQQPAGSVTASFSGYIDEPAIYNRALSASEIRAIYNAGVAGKCSYPLSIVSQPTDQTVIVSHNATFVVGVTGSQPISYQWSFNSANIAGATNSALTLTNIQANQAGSYSVVVSNASGSVASSPATLTVNPLPPCVTPPWGIVSWWSGASNAMDNVGGNNGYSVNGGSYVPGLVGTAFSFNGNNQCVRVPDSPSLQLTSALTTEAWIYPKNGGPNGSSILVKYDGSGSGQASYGFALTANLRPYLILSTDGSGGQGNVASPNSVPLNTWTHVAATYDGSQINLYINGQLDTSVPFNGSIFAGTDDLGIGGNVGQEPTNEVAASFSGYIDEPAIYNRALSSDEIAAIYNAGAAGKCALPLSIISQPADQTVLAGQLATFSVGVSGSQPVSYQWSLNGTNINGATQSTLTLTYVQQIQAGLYSVVVSNAIGSVTSSPANLTVIPGPPCEPPPSGIVSWWSAEGNALDNIGGNAGILVNGAGFVPGEVGQAFSFNGNQCVQVRDAPNLHLTNAMTLEAWVNPNQPPSSYGYSILVKYDAPGGSGGQLAYAFALNYNLQPYVILSTNGQSGQANVTGNGSVPLNAWTHVAATYDGSQISLYINGQLDSSFPFSGSLFPGTHNLGIGANVGGLPLGTMAAGFSGYIDEPAIYNRALSSDEIAALYNAGSSGKCPLPPTITIQPTNVTVLLDGSATFGVTASGSQPLFYQWNFNGTNIAGATQSTLTLTNLQFNQSGSYSVTVSNFLSIVASSTATLTVNPWPPCDSAPSGIVGWWSGEINAWDNVGGNNGYYVNSSGFTNGMVGTAFSFNGNNQCVRVPDAPNLRATTALTTEAWIYPKNAGQNGSSILVKYDAPQHSGQSAYGFALTSNLKPYLIISTNGTNAQGNVASSHSVPLNAWTHVAATYDGSQIKIYINGQFDTSAPCNGIIYAGTDDLGIGGNVGQEPSGVVVASFSGCIDEPAIYNRALSASEIQAIYNAGPSGKCGLALAPAIYVQPTDVSVQVGNSVMLTSRATGSPFLNYQWLFNGAAIPGATSNTLRLTNLQSTNTGAYALSVSNAYGTVVSSNAFVNVSFVTVYGNGQALTNAQYSFANSVTIQMQSIYANGYIFYTLDGSVPTPSSMFYSGPITLTNSAIIRTLGYTADFQQSAVSSPVALSILPTFTLSASTPGGGRVTLSPTGSNYIANTVVSVTATPSNGWTFLQWQGDINGTSPTNSVLMSRNKSVQAIFGTAVATSASGGSVVLNPLGGIYPYGTLLQASAVPQAGNYFVFWGSSASGNTNPLVYSVTTTNATIAALFTPLGSGQVSLTVVPVGHGTVSVNPRANSYTTGQSVTITATPNTGSAFLGWSGSASGTNNPLTLSLNQSKTIYANFTTNNFLSLHLGHGQGFSEGVEVDLNGEMGTHYQLEGSTNLTTWTPLFNVTNYVGTLHFIDTNASNFDQRFYRSVILP